MTVKSKDLPDPPAGRPKRAELIINAMLSADPFSRAVNRANAPEGLLGKIPPQSLVKVEAHLGSSFGEWEISQWRSAAELLAHWVDELHIQANNLRSLNAPKKRGRPPKASTNAKGLFGLGMLAPLMQPRKGGRPTKWPDDKKIHLANTLDLIRTEYQLRSYDAAIDKLIELIAAKHGKSARSTFKVPLKTIRGILSNVASRGRKLQSKPPK